MEKEFATARNKLRGMMNQAARDETKPDIARFFQSRTPVQDDGVHADPILGLRPEPVYVEKNQTTD